MNKFRTLDLAIKFHKESEKAKIKGPLKNQLTRASSSISLNLSEGNAKGSVADKKRFFQMAFGSLRECQTIFELADHKDPELDQLADHLGACLYKLLKSEIKPFR